MIIAPARRRANTSIRLLLARHLARIQDASTLQKTDEIPAGISLRILLVGGISNAHIVEGGHTQFAEKPLSVFGSCRGKKDGSHEFTVVRCVWVGGQLID